MGYETERNTESLLKSIATLARIKTLPGDDVWRLLQLTWITRREDHWKGLKVPALKGLFGKSYNIRSDLKSTVEGMELREKAVQEAAIQRTGFVNFYSAYRNSARKWCAANIKQLRAIVHTATRLGTNDEARFKLASTINQLPSVPSPSGKRKMRAANLITPLIACLDPKRRFPIVNGETHVRRLLSKLGLAKHDLRDQVEGLIGLIGHFGIVDAFAVDTLTDAEIDKIKKLSQKTGKRSGGGNGAVLADFDEAERKAVQKSQTVTYTHRHNKMTNRLKKLLHGLTLTQGKNQDCRYDVFVENYNGKGRHLLIEVKPDTDKGSIRIGIGQLLDYRRFLPQQAGIDLAVLTISRPPRSYVELLQDLQITPLWFPNEDCKSLAGDGKSWESLKSTIGLLGE